MCVCDNFIFGFCSASGGVDDNNDGGDGGGGTVSPAHQHTHKTLAAFLVKKRTSKEHNRDREKMV